MNFSTNFLPKIKKFKKSNFFHYLKIGSLFVNFGLILLVLFVFSGLVKSKNDGNNLTVLGKGVNFKELLPTPALYPVNKNVSSPPELTANSLKIIDADSAITLYEKNADLRVLPASTTKIMTALVALEQYPLAKILTVREEKFDGNTVKLKPGESLTVENLLYGLLVASGNDAAQVFAENFPGGTTGFVWAMNQKALELNLTNSHFTNAMGLDENGHYSSANDLARLTLVAIKNPVFARIVSTPEIIIKDVAGTKTHYLKNTNELVGKIQEIKGVKTGWTESAGECLVSLLEKDNKKLVIVLLGSQNRFGETEKIISWIFANFQWEFIVP